MEKETYQLGEHTLTLSEATVLIDMRRSRLFGDALETPDPDPDRQTLKFVFANCVAPVVDWGGREPITFEEFTALKSRVVNAWGDVVFRLNPEWEQAAEQTDEERETEQEADEKKVLS